MHSMPNFAVLEGESRHESSTKQQQAAIFVSDILEKTYSFNSFSASVFILNHHIFTYVVQRRSFLSSCYHLNRKQAFKVKNLVPITMHHGRCYWSRALYQVHMLMHAKRTPVLTAKSIDLSTFINRLRYVFQGRYSILLLSIQFGVHLLEVFNNSN